jgi:membrane-bound metal-dependent hydrolase YbcI (DUF457 family)
MVCGTACYLATGELGSHLIGQPLNAAHLATNAVVCAGASLLPDLDLPSSTVSRSLGPVTHYLSKIVGKVSGGHRNGTHSLLAAALAYIGVQKLMRSTYGPLPEFLICLFLVSLAIGFLLERSWLTHMLVAAFVAATVIVINPQISSQLPYIIVCGMLFHDICDMVTPEKVPPFWPLSKARIGMPIIGHSGDWRENLIRRGAGVAVVAMFAMLVFWPLIQTRFYEQNATTITNTAYVSQR